MNNTLPTEWCIKITPENKSILHKYWERLPYEGKGLSNFMGWLLSDRHDGSYQNWADRLPDGYTEITLDEFKKWVLKDGSDLVGKKFYHNINAKVDFTITCIENDQVIIDWVDISGSNNRTTYDVSTAYTLFKENVWIERKKETKITTDMPIAQLTQQSISRQDLKVLFEHVCRKWQDVIEKKLRADIFADEIYVDDKLLAEAFEEACPEQRILLLKYFKEPVMCKEVDLKRYIPNNTTFRESCNELLDVRNEGEYKGKGFYLPSRFNWEFKKDSMGLLCLIPTKP